MNHYLSILLQFNRDVRLYLFASLLFGFSLLGGIYSLLLNLYLLRLGYGPEFVGLFNATGALSFAVFSLPAIAMANRIGSRRTMIVGTIVTLVGYASLSQIELLPNALRSNFALSTYSFGLFGVALYVVSGSPFLMSIVTPGQRSHVFSLQAASLPLAGFAGSLIGGFLPGTIASVLGIGLEEPTAYRYALLISSLLMVPASLFLLATREPEDEQEIDTRPSSGRRPVGLILLVSFVSLLHVAGEGSVRTFFNVYMDQALGVSTSLIGAMVATGQLLAVPVALAVPLLSSSIGNRRTLIAGTVLSAIILVPLATFPYWIAAGVCYVATMGVAGVRRPSYVVFTQELVPKNWRTAMSGTVAMMSGLGYSGIAFGGGYIITYFGYGHLFLTGSALTAIGGLIFWLYFRKPRGEFVTNLSANPY